MTGTNVGMPINNLTEELREEPTSLKLDQDTYDTTTTIIHEVTSWRSMHYALRAANIKDLVDE